MSKMNHSTQWSASDVGGLCWVSDPAQAYIEARVTSVEKGVVRAEASDGRTFDVDLQLPLKPPSRKQKEPPRRILQRVPLTTNNGVENMDNLASLQEASILDNIQHRFRMDLIYTNTGPILIATNPFKWLPIYGDDVIGRYHNKPYGSLPPHCFQEAEDAFSSLQKTRRNHAVVICGESGAGKTETTKLMLHYLAVVSKRTSARDAKLKGITQKEGQQTIAERMVASNPLLEAFGNAKTIRNDNSSRFGKFTRFDFEANSSTINGGHIENLLLEKVRVVEQSSGERNFHVFYQLCAAAKAGKLPGAAGKALSGGDAASHIYSRTCTSVDDMDDAEEFAATVTALDALGVKGAELEAIFRAAAAVYTLGDVQFEAQGDGSQVTSGTQASLETAASLLGVDATKLAQALTTRVRDIAGEGGVRDVVTTPNDPHEASTLRHALSKACFSRLFDWLVQRANKAFDVSAGQATQFIGILDIFGFEDMTVNGFEQVFINTTNEQLQKVFNDLVFEAEAEEYTREGINWDKTAFPDNTPCIELLTKRPIGILRLLDSECSRGMVASDGAKLVAKVNKAHAASPFFEVCGPASVWRTKDGKRTEDVDFLVHHFAGPIVYTVSSFVDKNRDALFPHVHDVLHASSDSLVAACFPEREEVQSKKETVANKYLSQLASLTATLRESSTRFVRCIKTNSEKLPQKLDKPAVLSQLVCSGVMAALEVRRAGFPTRVPYRDFVREFRAFTPRGATVADPKQLAQAMMRHAHVAVRVPQSAYRLGSSKLFMRSEVLYQLQSIRNAMLYPFVRRLQRWWVKLQGSIVQRKLKRCGADLADCQAEAAIKGVNAVEFVRDALAKCEASLSKAQGVVNEPAKAAEVLVLLRQEIVKASQIVQAAVAKKEEAYRIRAEFLAEIDDAYSRCKALRTIANGLYAPRDAEGLAEASCAAESKLGACRTELLTVAAQWDQGAFAMSGSQGPHSLRAGAMRSMKAISAKQDTHEHRRQRLDQALTSVREAEALSQKMLERQRLLDEARLEFQAALDVASERLAVIPVEQFIIQGIRAVPDAVVCARDAIYEAQKALQESDPAPIRGKVEAAHLAVEKALARAESEALRLRAMTDLDECEKTLVQIGHEVRESGFEERIGDLVAHGEKCVVDARKVSDAPDVATLVRAARGAVDAVNHAGEQLEKAQAAKKAEEKARFNKLLGRFQRMDEANSGRGVPKFARKAGGTAKPLFKVKRVSTAPPPPPAPPPAPPRIVTQQPKAPFTPNNVSPTAAATPATTAKTPVPTPAGGHTLDSWIAAKNLGKYSAQLHDLAGDLHDLQEMTDADADELAAECAMPKLAARRFKKALLELGAPVHP